MGWVLPQHIAFGGLVVCQSEKGDSWERARPPQNSKFSGAEALWTQE